ncbi:hypothetical protein [Pedobacter nyackensis]|uniref:Uncharacterized protein n=1 Tax=Pedobacter nyackensis TaxID=475255 RepID=A0A1W2DRK6_9SPHI|nr:hypothetical protein [Pedobacter nyackensis]SMD00124.1 hypothetical protein SAMN04488101_1082 [Pedobacter nyackensis]
MKTLYPLEKHIPELEETLRWVFDPAPRDFFLKKARYDRRLLYRAAARYSNFTLKSGVVFISGAIQEMNVADVHGLANLFIQRAGRYIHISGYKEDAAKLLLVVLLAIEPELYHANDGGKSYKKVIEDVFFHFNELDDNLRGKVSRSRIYHRLLTHYKGM